MSDLVFERKKRQAFGRLKHGDVSPVKKLFGEMILAGQPAVLTADELRQLVTVMKDRTRAGRPTKTPAQAMNDSRKAILAKGKRSYQAAAATMNISPDALRDRVKRSNRKRRKIKR
jgi:hypothetical protein